ncbi:MAG: class I SAM-dependent DNA methyltransferase, partial [Promethearchaeota archaeon]
MNEVEDFQGINKIYNLFKSSLENNNHQKLKNCLKLIKLAENLFLKTYRKRKEEGVYYTSNDISDFMVTEALILLINKWNTENKIENIEDILRLNPEKKVLFCNTLLNIKICDPACGSGVFLLSMAEILYSSIKNLNPSLKSSKIKLQIINNLHGFDINESAIKLSILKLFDWAYQGIDDNFSNIISVLESNLKIKNSLIHSKIPKFDIILSNPPYGNILSSDEKELFKKSKIYHDIYCVFLMKVLEWSNDIIAFLVPKSFLLRQGYIEFRNTLLSNANILKIFDIGSKVFKKATNEVQITIYENKKISANGRKNLEIYDYPNKEI